MDALSSAFLRNIFRENKKGLNGKKPSDLFFLLWQGHQESNSGHVVLETTALPAELYPYSCCLATEPAT